MTYFDKAVLEMRQNQKEQKHTTLDTGIYVNKKLIEFKTEYLFRNQVDIMLPISFIDMPYAIAAVKYPSEFRPQIIKTSLDGTINFTFNLFDIPGGESERINEFANQFQAVLKQVNSSVKILEVFEEKQKEQYFKLFSYKSSGIDVQIYNLVCMTSIKNKILQETFNCLFDEADDWKDIAKSIFLTTKEHFL